MAKRLVLDKADQCPFCGGYKVFLKAFTEGVGEKRFAVSGQCAKCHVNGPQVFSEWQRNLPCFEDLPQNVRDDLIARALEKWNMRGGRPKVKVEDKGVQVPTCARKDVPIYECAYFEYEYDDLGKYCWCHNRESGRRECHCGYIYAQQFCPFYKKGDLRGKCDIGQQEIEAAQKFNEEWSSRGAESN